MRTPIPAPACTSHKAMATSIDGLKEDLVEERRQRELGVAEIKTDIKLVGRDVSKLKVDMAKLLGGIGVAIAILQVVLRYIPSP
jgi:hypothetical protein